MKNAIDAISKLAKPFFDEGAPKLYAATCCGRVFVGTGPVQGCRVCKRTDIVSGMFRGLHELSSPKDDLLEAMKAIEDSTEKLKNAPPPTGT